MAYQWEKVARAVWGAREQARLTRDELAALARVELRVVEQLEAVRPRGRRRLLHWHYGRIAAVEQVLGLPEGRVNAIALGFIDPATSVWRPGDATSDAFVRELRGAGLTREAKDVLTSLYLEDLARERLTGA